MKHDPKLHILLLLTFYLLASAFISPPDAFSEELEIINRPVNISGLTGLFFTTSPYTQAPGTVEVGAAIISENSIKPDFTITEYPASITLGLQHNAEVTVRSSYFHVKTGPTDSTTNTLASNVTGTPQEPWKTGNIDVSLKWNFMPQEEAASHPAYALIVGFSVPTEGNKNSDIKVNAETPNYWGVRLGLSAGSEITWKDHILGIYGDVQVRTEKRLHELYKFFNAGMLAPISKYQNLQMFMEYSIVSGPNIVTFDGGNNSGLTYGLRLVSERFNLTIGTQLLHPKTEGYDNSDRMMGMMSVKF
jgi:hypothetical protein